MKKLSLDMVAEEFEIISAEINLFFNTETGAFDFSGDFMDSEDDDPERFEEDCWIRCPSQHDINEYNIMTDFVDTVTDPRANELLSVALEGKGAFRRFKDTLHRVGLMDAWYVFKREAYIYIAREWCEENGIPYEDTKPKTKPPQAAIDRCSLDIIILPFPAQAAEDAAEVMQGALGYSRSDAQQEIRRMLKKPRVALAALADSQVIGIIGAIPQYGMTGWELHPLAVRKEYQRQGVASALIEALESEVAGRGGIMLYLGSDDETGTTSLYGADLYDDTFGKLANIQNIGGHPYPFYEKLGYKIVGVFPDANGVGKPDIWMAKRIRRAGNHGRQ